MHKVAHYGELPKQPGDSYEKLNKQTLIRPGA